MKTMPLVAFGFLALSATAQAAADPAAASAPAAAQLAPHSHMQEKTGAPPAAKRTDASKPAVSNDKTKHNHQRDAK